MATDPPCPCGAPRTYSHCCGRWHAGPLALQAPDAEALMRSRYSAYVLGLAPYLLATWHPDTRPDNLTLAHGMRWLGLSVKRHLRTGDASATVEFVARSKATGAAGGRAARLHELSRFCRVDGRWFYLDGQTPADRPTGP